MIFAIGALGGSGTRVVARMLIECGIFMGDLLNEPFDNLLFSGLFKNPAWYINASPESKNKRLELFAKYMSGDYLLPGERISIIHKLWSNRKHDSGIKTLSKFLTKKSNRKNKDWGWKEPNTLIYLPEIAKYFNEIKYIHVIRHGLDMAFSKNLQQLHNWGFIFDTEIEADDNENDIARKQLDYWIKANNYAIDTGRKLLGNNFYLMSYQSLCDEPTKEILKLIDFLEFNASEDLVQRLIKIPVMQNSNLRYHDHNISLFSEHQLAEVRQLGFTI